MTSVDETTQQVHQLAVQRRRLPAFDEWAWSPIIILRIALVLEYAAGVYFGVASFNGGVPVFEVTASTSDWWTPAFGIGMAVFSFVCTIAAFTDRWIKTEMVAGILQVALMGSYTLSLTIVGYVLGDTTRQAVAAVALQAWILPACRLLWNLAQLGKKKSKSKR